MALRNIDWSPCGWARVIAVTTVGTLVCIAVAFLIDSYSFESGLWRLGNRPINNVIIPLVLAPPFFIFLLTRMRQLAIAQHELMNVAATDGLTSCLNRRAFTAMVDGYLARVAQHQERRSGALLLLDVDHFKLVNDQFGHDRGDEALKLIVRVISEVVRDIDLVGRMGGEEFGVFLPGVAPNATAAAAERIRLAVANADFRPDGQPYTLSASIGGTNFNGHATFTELYRVADQRLYSAKRHGRNRIEIEPPAGHPAMTTPSIALH